MAIQVTYRGAAGNVTGSCTLVETPRSRFVVDCGLFQERALKGRNWEPVVENAGSLQAVLLTHAHLDHCGRLPRLVKEGFSGDIVCTPATRDIAEIVLRDAARLQEEDVAFKQKRHRREGRSSPYPYEPLYTVADVERTMRRFRTAPYGKPVEVADGVAAEFYEAGHIFGSAFLRVAMAASTGAPRTILFSGDMGRAGLPIQRDPAPAVEADVVQVESTYGNRLHGAVADIPSELASVVNGTVARGGNVVIPSFAVERAQELLYFLGQLLREDRVPHLQVFVDSPMAISVTEVFARHPELFDREARDLMDSGGIEAHMPSLHLTRSTAESKSINRIRGSAIIIAGSGMCTGGRIKHHLKANLPRPESTILFVGYQAAGTLGRILLDGAKSVRLFGAPCEVKARIVRMEGFSAHADREELTAWLSGVTRDPDRVFVNHGEPEAAQAFAGALHKTRGWKTVAPELGDTLEI